MFVCERNEFGGWTTYIPYATLEERFNLHQDMIDRMIEIVRSEGYTVEYSPPGAIVLRENRR